MSYLESITAAVSAMINSQKSTDFETVMAAFKRDGLRTDYLPAIEGYTKLQKMDFNVMNAGYIYNKLNFIAISRDIMPVIKLFNPTPTDERSIDETRTELRNRNFKDIDIEIAILKYMLKDDSDIKVAEIKVPELAQSITEGTIAQWVKKVGDRVEKGEFIVELETDKVNAEIISEEEGVLTQILAEESDTVLVGQVIAVVENLKKRPIKDILKKSNESAENIIAIKKLVDELEQNYSRLVALDLNFLNSIVTHRPLIALVMLTKPTLNKILIENYYIQLYKYIENEEVYEKINPFIKVHDGKTHGQWRHLSDPSKTCIVLTTKNCKIASSKNTQKSYEKSEIEGKFLVLQGLSIQADSDNAEVHYLEV